MHIRISDRMNFQLIIYLNTVINYHIWKYRNDCVHNAAKFEYTVLIARILRTVGARRNWQKRLLTDSRKIIRIDDLYVTMLTIHNITSHVTDNMV